MSAEVERKVQEAIDALNGLYGPVDKSKRYEILTGLVQAGMAIERKRSKALKKEFKRMQATQDELIKSYVEPYLEEEY